LPSVPASAGGGLLCLQFEDHNSLAPIDFLGSERMIARLKPEGRSLTPVFDLEQLKTESDVEQKLLYPFLCHPSYIGMPPEWVRTKEYMEPTQIDKSAGKRAGYIPDYSVWLGGFPLIIVEAKSPEETVEKALREARLYAGEINKRYPPNINPIGYVLACNGEQIALTQWDSETEVLTARAADIQPGSGVLSAFLSAISKEQVEQRATAIGKEFQVRKFFRVAAHMTGMQIAEQLGINEFARPLVPIITRYFTAEPDETPDEIIDRAYVTTSERTEYDGILESFLKDRARVAATSNLTPIVTGQSSAGDIGSELSRYRQNPKHYGRVQLIVGAVGAGKSLFIRRFYRRMLPKEVVENTMWAFINFNVQFPADQNLRDVIADRFIRSFEETNNVDLQTLEVAEKLFHPEMRRFDRGPAKQLLPSNKQQFDHQRYLHMRELMANKEAMVRAVSRHFIAEKRKGIVVVFDNVDKRSRDLQLEIFEGAQWVKDITNALVIVNLRDTTFEAHRDEKPLDAFIHAVNFYITPPRFAAVIRKRLELVLEQMAEEEFEPEYTYTLETGARITYKSEKLTEYLKSIYDSLFERRASNIGAQMEALVARNVRVALGMFADIIASPHIPTSQLTTAAVTAKPDLIPEERVLRALMRGRYRLFGNNRGPYVRNVLAVPPNCKRPSNFLYADILEFLIRNRKVKIDFSVEGYASAQLIVNKMSQLGYDEEDAFTALRQLVVWNLVEPESLILEQLTPADPVQVHASGFIHVRYLMQIPEYIVGTSADMTYSSYETSTTVASIWNSVGRGEPGYRNRRTILEITANYMAGEYDRRRRRHAFYDDLGYGGKIVVQSTQIALRRLTGETQYTRAPVRSRPPRR
jgi:GTPase SAR1 family protein